MSDNTQTTTAPAGVEISVNEQAANDISREQLVDELRRAVARIHELEAPLDAGKLVGRPDAVVEHAAKIAHEVNRAYCRSLGDDSQPPWDDAPDWQKNSARIGVKSIAEHPDMTPAQQHTLWCAVKIRDGWTYGAEKDVDAKTHPCLVPYAQLLAEQQVKDALFGAVVRSFLGL